MTRFAVTVELESDTKYFPVEFRNMTAEELVQHMKGVEHQYPLLDTFLIYSTKIVVTSLKEIAP